ncbi:MAG TPA: hypothetical protein VKE70_14255 [Candidatus Solibacter sp.]|jgi:hypothetical protein|nr:hypothetical protein [Candidatus Solibacter sp.]
MFPETTCFNEVECPICYARHDEEIHEATLRLRNWFHHQVTHRLHEEEFFETANASMLEARVA